jgi:alkanesulfonate monooxygenase SsuD/methylene tetrahydromethanopterin reductase-like flavin-dependent oxidoreductase (luciferase family)
MTEPRDEALLTETGKPRAGAGIRFGALLWTERATWTELQDAALTAEESGLDSLWCSDHLFAATGAEADPCFEVWTTLAAIGALTSNIEVGLLVAAIGLRNPGVIAKAAATLDHITNGRAVLGLGSGWLEREYDAHGIDWAHDAATRAQRLEEGAEIIVKLLAGEPVTYHGSYYQMEKAKHSPRPVQSKVPLLIGGEGNKTLGVVARFADMWNARGSVEKLRLSDQVLRLHCDKLGRPEQNIERLTNRWVTVRSSHTEARLSLERSLSGHGITDYDDGIVALGPPEEVAEQLAPTIAAGFKHIVCSFRSPFDHESIQRLGEVRHILAGTQ